MSRFFPRTGPAASGKTLRSARVVVPDGKLPCPDGNAEPRRIAGTEPQKAALEIDLRPFLLRRAGP